MVESEGVRQTFVIVVRRVGGGSLLRVKVLRSALMEAEFEHVETYINTGNVVLISSAHPSESARTVAKIVLDQFAFSKAIMMVNKPDWERLIADNPFPERAS